MRVGIQGVRASFHDAAARKFFQGAELSLVECSSFPLLFQKLHDKEIDVAVVAIENAIAGSILPNYGLMERYQTKIRGEVYLPIELSLMGLPDETLEDVRFVQSHPMALLQCQDFLSTLPSIKVLEHADTADGAAEIVRKNLKGFAGIAHEVAAETYGLKILKRNIESNKANATRFLILDRKENFETPKAANRASLRFEVPHEPGGLARAIAVFETHHLNMTKIQSLPVLGRPFHYCFHVDIEWVEERDYQNGLIALQEVTTHLIHFGEYLSGQRIWE